MKSYFLKVAALFIVPVSISLAAATCNNATIKGRYARLAYGTQVNNESFNTVGTIVFDGNGRLTGSGVEIVNGAASEYISEGTYLVLKDCSVKIDESTSSAGPNPQFGMLANGGKKIFAILSESGRNFSLIYEKQ
ncbi:MAG: hypothetical protein QX199_07980 [Methylococcaceae bacterium]